MDALITGLLDGLMPSISGGNQFLDYLNAVGVTPNGLKETLNTAASAFAERMATFAAPFLTACLAIRLIMGTIKELADGDFVDLISTYLMTAIMGVILYAMLTQWAVISGWVVDIMNTAVGAATSGGDVNSVFEGIATDGLNLLKLIWDIVFNSLERMTIAGQAQGASLGQKLVGMVNNPGVGAALAFASLGAPEQFALFLINALLGLVASLAVIALVVVLLYHSISGFIAVFVAIAFGPLTLAAYPLVDTWAKKLLGTAAGGIGQMLAALFLLSVLGEILERAASLARGLSGI